MVTTSLTRDLETTRKIVLKHLIGYHAKVYLFGSQAKGKAYRSSDIDVAILPLHPFPTQVLSEIREDLDESDILYPVDLVDLSETDEKFRQRVQKEGTLWKE
ncbi:MAG TPA: nucleotidyltransferase domain-containing protein [Anaerolineales bacterium]|nr:nucleotidyltransferase domain-containing protein [Anaerolineales bacterium]HLO33036.1 nucleotidyltransferase domain-containing protein [Anaerolineales bacterium]